MINDYANDDDLMTMTHQDMSVNPEWSHDEPVSTDW
jgi:hypothetical protein